MGDWTQVFLDSGDTCYLTDSENLAPTSFSMLRSCRAKPPHSPTTSTLYSPFQSKFKSRLQSSIANLRNQQQPSYDATLKALDSMIFMKPNKHNAHKQADNLGVMRECISKLELDLTKLSVIHVAGTKGKGSTCAFCESLLRNAGFKTGLYTSPHLIDVRERIRINGEPLDESLFIQYFWEVWNQLNNSQEELPSMATYFRFLTLLSFKVFLEERVDVAIVEVGIGGRLDATNVIPNPVVSGIASLGLDHCSILGNTIEEIAFEKAGIIKFNRPVITVPQPIEAMREIQKKAAAEQADLTVAPAFSEFETLHYASKAIANDHDGLRLGIQGAHQRTNASLALSLARVWMDHHHAQHQQRSPSLFDPHESAYRTFGKERIPYGVSGFPAFRLPHAFVHGLAACQWPGRSQVVRVPGKSLRFYLDGAHTIESIQFCRDWFLNTTLEEGSCITSGNSSDDLTSVKMLENEKNTAALPFRKRKKQRVLVFNLTGERDAKSLLEPFAEVSEHLSQVVFCPTDSVKDSLTKKNGKAQCGKLQQLCIQWEALVGDNPPARVADSVEELVFEFMRKSTKDVEIEVLVTGSLYLVGDMLNRVRAIA